jgi:luciferase family oxidoreductase group 1
MVPISILDLSPIIQGGTAGQALRNSRDLAQHAEKWGYRRYWLAEHHNMPGIASAATAVAIGYVAAGTERIRIGAGGIMLPNHAPLVIAEQFGTLESLFPGRIDLGLGRAPGTDPLTAQALRRDRTDASDTYLQDVVELQRYFGPAVPHQAVRAVPGVGLGVPLWLLGSSLYSARLAAAMGLPFAFASHFAPDHLAEALKSYREEFRPSATVKRPYCMAVVAAYAAETDAAAAELFTSLQLSFIGLRRGAPAQLPPPVSSLAGHATPLEIAGVEHAFSEAIVGSAATVRRGAEVFLRRTGVDELMVTAAIFDHGARLRSFEIVAQALIGGQRIEPR